MPGLQTKLTETAWVAVRTAGTWVLCLGIYYFYDKAIAGGEETRRMGVLPYLVITLWLGWIFLHNRMLLRKFALTKKISIYLLLLVSGIMVTVLLQQQLMIAFRGSSNPLPGMLWSVTFYTFIGALVFLAFQYIKERRDFFQIKALKKEVELQQLKNQLNPHFLFNSLNNIYSYNLENNTYGNDLILKLSQLMRFIVESTREEVIPLRDEMNFIDNYIAFEKERLGYRCDILYEKKVSPGDRRIPPLLLFPFIENAFKHGSDTIGKTKIYIEVSESGNTLSLAVRNDVVRKNGHSTHVGLSNVERRLDLLFPGKYALKAGPQGDEYVVDLTLELS